MNASADLARPGVLIPGSLGPRIAAGLVDALAIVVLAAAAIVATTVLAGGSMPLLALFAAVLGWSVVPMATFGATPGMGLFGLSIVGPGGERVDLLEALFREMVGRGWFAVAYLATLLMGLVLTLTGRGTFTMPVGPTLLFSLFALAVLVLAALGHLAVLARDDRRSLADLMAKTRVVARPPALPPVQVLDEADEWEALGARRRLRNFVVFQILLVAATVGVPLLLTLDMPSFEERAVWNAQRDVRLEGLRMKFDKNPASAEVAGALTSALFAAGLEDEAEAVRARHDEAAGAARAARESMLLARLAAAPTDGETLSLLLELLEETGRLDEAAAAYGRFVAATGEAADRAGYGVWLFHRDLAEAAVDQLTRARDDGAESARLHGYLGLAYEDLARLEEAQAAYRRALELDPDQPEVARYLARVDAALGPAAD